MGWGSSTRRGGGRRVRALPFRRRAPGMSPGILLGCPGRLGVFEKLVQRKIVLIFRSLYFDISQEYH